MNTRKFILISAVILISGCRKPDLLESNQPDSTIGRNNTNEITEISTISIGDDCGTITDLRISSNPNEIIVYCLGNGELNIYDIESKSKIESYHLGIVSREMQISKNGNSIVGPLHYSNIGKSIGNIKIWTMADISNPFCVDWCFPGDEEVYGPSIAGVAISDDGKLAAAYTNGPGIFINNIENNQPEVILLSEDADWSVSIGDIAFHPNGKKYAVSYLLSADSIKADVQIYRFTGFFYTIPSTVSKKSNIEYAFIKSLLFSPDGKWLASINDKGVNIWRLNILKNQTVLDKKSANQLVFDEDSELLLIISSNRIEVYDLKYRKIIATWNTPNITSISFREDNEVFVWGDSNGVVHVWGNR